MSLLNRRHFLGSSLGRLTAAFSFGPSLMGNATLAAAQLESTAPDTLFLSMHRDPTTAVTAQ